MVGNRQSQWLLNPPVCVLPSPLVQLPTPVAPPISAASMAASSPRVRGDICYLPWCRCDGEALWVPPPGLRGSLPPSVGRRQEGQQTRKAQSGLLTLEARQPSPSPKGVHPFIHPKIAVARNGHHVVTTSFG